MHQGRTEAGRSLIGARTVAAATLGAALVLRTASRFQRRISFRDRSVLITGARGLALELARLFAREGSRLTLLARDESELERAHWHLESEFDADVLTLTCDLRDGNQIDSVMQEVLQARNGVDVLINNAGIIRVGPFHTMAIEDYDEAMDVHFTAPLRLAHHVIPGMKERGVGRIVNISSIGGLVAVPHLSPYVASKFALTGLSQTMTSELAPQGIRVTTVCPGLMRTGGHVHALFRGDPQREFIWFSWLGNNPFFSTSSEHAARRILKACRYGESRVTITPQAKILKVVDSLAPGLVAGTNALVARLLPDPQEVQSERPGWQSTSRAAPSFMTQLGDRQVEHNNELDAPHALAYRSPHSGNGRQNGQSH